MLPAPPHKNRLFRSQRAIDPRIKSVRVARRRRLLQIIGLRPEIRRAHIDVWRGNEIQQRRRHGVDAILRAGASAPAWYFVPWIWLPRERIHQWRRLGGKIPRPHGIRWHK